jgi:sn-glycerol 3-phosphate transport system ATP-binding protein
VEYLGADSILNCLTGDQALAVRAPGRVDLPAGAAVTLTWKPEATHLFDATTGRRCGDAPRTASTARRPR